MTVTAAIQGIRGSYSEEAAAKMLGPGARIKECDSFESAMKLLAAGQVEFAVLPVENRIIGRITVPAELAENSGRPKVDEIVLPINHVLAGTADSEMPDIETIVSHPAALLQCSRFLKLNPQLRCVEGNDTASSIRTVRENCERTSAAIGSRRAAEIYGAKVLSEDIADAVENWTKFYLIG